MIFTQSKIPHLKSEGNRIQFQKFRNFIKQLLKTNISSARLAFDLITT